MEAILILLLVFFILGIVLYILYVNGYMVINSKSALKFVGTMGRGTNHCQAAISACNGYMKRVIKFKESREYNFVFDCEITKGAVGVEIQNADKKPVLVLDSNNRSGSVMLDEKNRYYLILNFTNADGKYKLTWN